MSRAIQTVKTILKEWRNRFNLLMGEATHFPEKKAVLTWKREKKKKKLAIFVNYHVWNLKPQKRKTDELNQM